jgi:TPR repeat protein
MRRILAPILLLTLLFPSIAFGETMALNPATGKALILIENKWLPAESKFEENKWSINTEPTEVLSAGLIAYQKKDYATALREWKPFAEEGYAYAQLMLAGMYREGEGIPQDYGTAIKWYRVLAKRGDNVAHFALGEMYRAGHGVSQDLVKAHMWFNLSAASGHTAVPESKKNAAMTRDEIAKEMTSRQISKAQILARECVAKNYKGC